ncbi:hypothetical protein CBS101457_000647 [Exobasidium rhododendri]|nr:hypothetical protein CBS101457_000647 [Exobasidium rhododendri]
MSDTDALHQARSIYHESTIQSADSIESHPSKAGIFALGTYQVDQEKETDCTPQSQGKSEDDVTPSSTSPEYSRRGTLRLKKLIQNADDSVSCDTLCEIETAAILDMKWLHPASSFLSVALANSSVSIYKYREDNTLELFKSIHVNDTQALCLSLDWSDRSGGHSGGYKIDESSSSSPHAIISQSDGTLAHVASVMSSAPTIQTWKAHDYEAWTTAYDCWSDGNIVWSGGDDLTLKGWDLRTSCADGHRIPTFSSKKCFEGGVTSMQSHHLRQHLWAVGSYDGHLRLFDARHPVRPVSTTSAGGGIWRTKWHPSKADQLLLGCMHDGFKVMHLDSLCDSEKDADFPRKEMQLMTRFDEHKSLAYGCDWDRSSTTSPDRVYSCSFYDSTLHAWSVCQ